MPKKVRPITPNDVALKKQKTLPDAVLESFNELIAQNWDGHSATILQDDVVALMVDRGLKREEIHSKRYLDVEDIYRSAGWIVEYDRPAYNESYPTRFVFKRKRS